MKAIKQACLSKQQLYMFEVLQFSSGGWMWLAYRKCVKEFDNILKDGNIPFSEKHQAAGEDQVQYKM